MTDLIKKDTGEVFNVPDDKLSSYISSGLFSPTVNMVIKTPEGRIGEVAPPDIMQALTEAGGNIASPEETLGYHNKKEFGNKQFQAAGAGLLRGVSFGTSDLLARMAGGQEAADYLHNLEKYNPIISGASTFAGAILPALLTSGGTTVAEGADLIANKGIQSLLAEPSAIKSAVQTAAEFAPTNLAAKAGHFITHEVANSALVKQLSSKGLSGEAIANILSRAAGTAVEAAPFGAAQALSEEALGDEDINATKLLAHMGTSAVVAGEFGAGLGSLIGATETFVPKIFKVGQDRLSNFWQKKQQLLQEDMNAQADSLVNRGFVTEGNALKKFSNFQENESNFLSQSELGRQRASGEFATALEKQFKSTDEVQKFMESGARGEYIKGLINPNVSSEVGRDAYGEIEGFSNTILDKMKAEPDYYPPKFVAKLEHTLNAYGPRASKLDMTAGDQHNLINNFKRALGDEIEWDYWNVPKDEQAARKLLVSVYNKSNSILEDARWGEAASEQAKLSNFWENYFKTVQKPFKKSFLNQFGDVDAGKVLSSLKKMGKESDQVPIEAINNYFAHTETLYKDILPQILDKVPKKGFDLGVEMKNFTGLKGQAADLINNFANKNELAALKEFKDPLGFMSTSNLVKQGLENVPVPGAKLLSNIIPGDATPYDKVQKLLQLHRINQSQDQVIGSLMDKITTGKGSLSAVEKIISKTLVPLVGEESQAFIGHGAIDGYLHTIEHGGENIDSINSMLGKSLSDPQGLQNTIAKNLERMNGYAPKTATAVAVKTVRTLQYLYNSAPKDSRGSIEKMLNNSPKIYPDVQLGSFGRKVKSAQNPLYPVLELAQGRPSQEGKEVLQGLHTNFYHAIGSQLMQKISDSGGSLPYEKRIQLGQFFGLPTDSTLNPAAIQAYQGLFQSKSSMNQSMGPRPRAGQAKHLDMSNSMMTGTQRIQSRKR